MRRIIWSAVLVLGVFTSAGQAGTIASLHAVEGPGLGDANLGLLITGAANNDPVTSPSNLLMIGNFRFDVLAPITLVFNAADSFTAEPASAPGVTEYQVAAGAVNNTGQPWIAYRIELGAWTEPGFTPLTAGLLAFDTNDASADATMTGFIVDHDDHRLLFTGGLINHNQAASPNFRIDIPNFAQSGLPVESQLTGGYRFAMRFTPIGLPEPATAAMLTSALLLAGRRKRHR